MGVLKNKFTSFVKTRVSCSVPGNIPFDFDEIRKLFANYAVCLITLTVTFCVVRESVVVQFYP